MSEKIADVIKETENNKADRQEQYFSYGSADCGI